jgi:hypothetical protein
VSGLRGSLPIEGTLPAPGAARAAKVRWCAALVGLVVVWAPSAIVALLEREAQQGAPGAASPSDVTPPVASAYGGLPLAFVPNVGQADPRVRYQAQGPGYGLFFTERKATVVLRDGARGYAVQLRFVGADPSPRLEPADRGTGKVNYFTGSERRTGLPTYGRLTYRGLWPGVDMVFEGKGGRLTYEFRVHSGADVSDIRLAYAGANEVSLDARGGLRIHTPLGTLRDAPPRSFQRIDGRRVPVASSYALVGDSYGFAVRGQDPSRALLIDPSLSYSTYLGASLGDGGAAITVDSTGAAYVTGFVGSADFPSTPGAFDTSFNAGDSDAFVTKLDPAGSDLVYSTYLGGSSYDSGLDISVDAAGAAYVAGGSSSMDFPATPGAFGTSANGDFDAFVTKLSPTGALAYSTYLGGSSIDSATGVEVDAAGGAYVTGNTFSTDFPTTLGAFDRSDNSRSDAFVARLNPAGSALTYSTYLGGVLYDTGWDIAFDAQGAMYVVGVTHSPDFPATAGAFDTSFDLGDPFPSPRADAFVTKLTPAGSGLAYSTYLGGSSGFHDYAYDIAVDSGGAAYITGETSSADFPTTPGGFDTSLAGSRDAFVTKLDPAGSDLAYSTYLGGSDLDGSLDIAVDPTRGAYVTGTTESVDFPITPDAFDTSANGGSDAFIAKLDSFGTDLAYSTYLGGDLVDVAVGLALDSQKTAYITGLTYSSDFPTTAGAFDAGFNGFIDAFVTKVAPGAPPSTPRCRVTGGGQITAANSDTATFGGTARSSGGGTVEGHERYRDHGPAEPQDLKSIRILALTCDQTGTQATIIGEATIDGSGTHAFRIEVQDLGEPGKGEDAYRILLDTGYDSGAQPLQGGNVQIRRG